MNKKAFRMKLKASTSDGEECHPKRERAKRRIFTLEKLSVELKIGSISSIKYLFGQAHEILGEGMFVMDKIFLKKRQVSKNSWGVYPIDSYEGLKILSAI
ncbi:MAG: hypothetical protein ACOYL6_16400 [Bacteriovoracaceae bacterium]